MGAGEGTLPGAGSHVWFGCAEFWGLRSLVGLGEEASSRMNLLHLQDRDPIRASFGEHRRILCSNMKDVPRTRQSWQLEDRAACRGLCNKSCCVRALL